MLKDNFLENIIDIFRRHERFEYIDFKIERNQKTFTIIYLIEPKFYISFNYEFDLQQDNKNTALAIKGEVCPGKLLLKEDFILVNKEDICTQIKSWIDAIWAEVSYTSFLAISEEEHKQLDKFCNKFESMEGYFTSEEIIEAIKELKKLKKELREYIIPLVLDESLQKEELNKLNKDFETLEETIPFLKKRGWIRSLTGRVLHNSHRLLYSYHKGILEELD